MHRSQLRSTSVMCFVTFVAAIVQAGVLHAEDDVAWFRRNNGVAREGMILPSEFGEGKARMWRVELPPGISTPCLCGNSIFVTTYVAESKELATVALDRMTGQIRWKKVAPVKTLESFHAVGSPTASTPSCNGTQAIGGGNYYASIVAGDGKVYVISEGGVVTILKAGRDWSILDSFDFKERILATPVFADGMMPIRTDNALYAFRAR